jgi:hypothetical protein
MAQRKRKLPQYKRQQLENERDQAEEARQAAEAEARSQGVYLRRRYLPCLLLALCLLLVTSGAWARNPLTVAPQSVGLSQERLERITANVRELIDNDQLAGAVTLGWFLLHRLLH